MTTESKERTQLDALDNLNITQLRAAAKLLKIGAEKDWEKEDFVKAIQNKQSSTDMTMVLDDTLAPRPGFARVMIHRDPSVGHKNSPVPVSVNGLIYQVPRGIDVDIPIPFVEALKNAKTASFAPEGATAADGMPGKTREVLNQSYPFSVTGITPGEWRNKNDGRAAGYALREEFLKMFGSWPTAAELKDAQKAKLIAQAHKVSQ